MTVQGTSSNVLYIEPQCASMPHISSLKQMIKSVLCGVGLTLLATQELDYYFRPSAQCLGLYNGVYRPVHQALPGKRNAHSDIGIARQQPLEQPLSMLPREEHNERGTMRVGSTAPKHWPLPAMTLLLIPLGCTDHTVGAES